jgi:hypothetical protein
MATEGRSVEVWTGWVRVGGEKGEWVKVLESEDYGLAWRRMLAVELESSGVERLVSRGTRHPDDRKRPR